MWDLHSAVGALTSYFLAALALASADNIMWLLGALLPWAETVSLLTSR
jgi:hypothetical protein